MSEVQYKKVRAQAESLRQRVEVAQKAIKTSEACQTLIAQCKDTTQEPFHPDFTGHNPWTDPDPHCLCQVL